MRVRKQEGYDACISPQLATIGILAFAVLLLASLHRILIQQILSRNSMYFLIVSPPYDIFM